MSQGQLHSLIQAFEPVHLEATPVVRADASAGCYTRSDVLICESVCLVEIH